MRVALLITQGVALAAVVAGTALIFWPAALIVGGALTAAVIERQT